MVVGAAGVETVNRVASGGLMEVARCAVGKTKLVEVDLCRIRRDGHDSLRIAEIAKDWDLLRIFSRSGSGKGWLFWFFRRSLQRLAGGFEECLQGGKFERSSSIQKTTTAIRSFSWVFRGFSAGITYDVIWTRIYRHTNLLLSKRDTKPGQPTPPLGDDDGQTSWLKGVQLATYARRTHEPGQPPNPAPTPPLGGDDGTNGWMQIRASFSWITGWRAPYRGGWPVGSNETPAFGLSYRSQVYFQWFQRNTQTDGGQIHNWGEIDTIGGNLRAWVINRLIHGVHGSIRTATTIVLIRINGQIVRILNFKKQFIDLHLIDKRTLNFVLEVISVKRAMTLQPYYLFQRRKFVLLAALQ